MVKLDLSKNSLGTKEAGEALSSALKENTALKELNLSDNLNYSGDDYEKNPVEFAVALSLGLSANGALTSLDISSNSICAWGKMEGIEALAEAIKVHVSALRFF